MVASATCCLSSIRMSLARPESPPGVILTPSGSTPGGKSPKECPCGLCNRVSAVNSASRRKRVAAVSDRRCILPTVSSVSVSSQWSDPLHHRLMCPEPRRCEILPSMIGTTQKRLFLQRIDRRKVRLTTILRAPSVGGGFRSQGCSWDRVGERT